MTVMKDPVLVSVIMPVHNAGTGEALNAAVQSVLSQQGISIELIVCDDASDDDTMSCLEKLSEKDERMVLLHSEKRLFAGGARNQCLKAAQGKYIALMDADDISLPGRFLNQVHYLDQHPGIDFVGVRTAIADEVSDHYSSYYWFVEKPRPHDFLMTLPFVHASLMFRSQVLESSGGYCENRYVRRSEDYELIMRLYSAGSRGANLKKVLYLYRVDGETLRRRKYRYRWNECVVKFKGFSRLGLMPLGIPYALKPLLVGLLPREVLNRTKKRYYHN